MQNTTLFTVLHISDFHFSPRKQREQGIVVDALINDLKTICVGHRKPDLVLFTGDLVHAGGVDSHEDAYDFLLDKVSKATGCSDERIFIIAGNHDVNVPGLELHSEEHKQWRALIGKDNETKSFNEIYDASGFDAAAARKFANFYELEKYIRGDDHKGLRRLRTAFATVDHIKALNIDIVCFNTSVLSTGGHKGFKPDERNLAIPEYAIMEAVKALTPDSYRIFLSHHPTSMLSEQSARYLEGEITKHANLHFFGHMHDPQPRNTVGLKGQVLSDQAGALFTARKDYYNGYALITIDRDYQFAETMMRSYYKDRNEFDEAIDIVEGGRWWSSPESKQHFRKIAAPVDDKKFREHLTGAALSALQARESAAGNNDSETHTRFVEPPLRRTYVQGAVDQEGKVEIETPVSFAEIAVGDSNLILFGKAEYGRTTLLRELRYRLLAEANEVGFPRLPILIDYDDVSSNVDNMLRKIRGGAEELPADNDVESLLKLGHACVIVDDVIFADINRMRVLREFVARFPKARYVLSSPYHSATKFGACIDPEMPLRFDFVEVREFGRNNMRQLLAQEARCTDVEEWLDRLQKEFKEINLPFTAANGSILIEILSVKYNFTPINRSVLMEQFVDSTLRKAAIEQSRRETFDYTNKTDLLSHLAAWMARKDEYVVSSEAIRTEMKAYVQTRGLNVKLDELLIEFMAARIFTRRADSRISFRYRGVLEYFIALRMTVEPVFKDWIMEEERYLRFINEIQYYAGKLRNDAVLVDLIGSRHERIMKEALTDFRDLDFTQLDSLQLPSNKDSDDLESTTTILAFPPLSLEEKDAELEADFPIDAEDRQEVYRPKINETTDRVTLSLILYSGMVRNMELIDDVDKRRHLSSLWRGWALMLMASLRFAPRLAKDRRVRVNGALYEVQAPQGMKDTELLRQMMLHLPHVHVRMMSNALGTEKLEQQLSEPTLAEQGEPKIYDFLRTGLIADLRLPSTPGQIDRLATKLKDNKYLLWALVIHVTQLRRLDQISEAHFRSLEIPLAGAIANLKGGSHEERAKEKRKQITRLAKDRLLLTIKKDK